MYICKSIKGKTTPYDTTTPKLKGINMSCSMVLSKLHLHVTNIHTYVHICIYV